jgi:hypothetical protein
VVEVGVGGPTVLFLANYDTRPGTPGAYRNASAAVALLALSDRFRGWRGHRVLVAFLGAEAFGAAPGAWHCRDALEAATSSTRSAPSSAFHGLGCLTCRSLSGLVNNPSGPVARRSII